MSSGMSQQKLAQASGVSIGTVRAIETSVVVDPGIFTVVALAKALGVELTSLVSPPTRS
jgi:transcriptional regulator with XRE-family HTH domain